MRVVAEPRRLDVEPGDKTALRVDVVNTDDVIDGVSAHIIGFPVHCVSANPVMLPLFPDAGGTVNLDLAVPRTHPAGRHALTVEVVSHGTRNAPGYIDVDLDVAARPSMRLESRPRLIRSRRSARYVLELTNTGNVPLDVAFEARDPDRRVQTTFTPSRRRVEPGAVAPVMLGVRGPRMFTGAEIDRTVVVAASGEPVGVRPDDVDDPSASPTLVRETSVQLRQRPLIGRGLLTVLILLSIVGGWAAIFLFGLAKVFANDPMTKEAPASFFASLDTNGATPSSGAHNFAPGSGAGGDPAPAGALSKNGQLPAGMGGVINGVVISTNDKQPVGRILVQAYRRSDTGLRLMSSGASQSDGTYSLAGLFPTAYYIKFSAAGYKTQWYPNRPSTSGAQPVTAVAQGSTSNINAPIVGLPASISGIIDPGDTLKRVRTKVTARPLLGAQTGRAIATTTTNGKGAYTLKRLPAPGSYELTFTTTGYQSSTLVDSVGGGDKRLEPTVTIAASSGQITGIVTDGGTPLGGATVTTTVAGRAVRFTTPTTGQVGLYVLGNLPTPGTYVVTVAKPGHGSTTTIVDLAAGQSRSGLNMSLASGTGSITGRVVGASGRGLGGATVTVGGATTSTHLPSATTLTAGSPGSFSIDGLRAPGSYTLTATLDGYGSASVPIQLSSTSPATFVTIRLQTSLGRISGLVVGSNGRGFAGATVTASDGRESRITTSNSSGGGYLFSGLDPGSYSVTVTSPGLRQETALVTVTAGHTTRQNLRLGA
jgi:hypothetical protein